MTENRVTDADLALELVNKFHFAVGIWRLETNEPDGIILEALNPASQNQFHELSDTVGRPLLQSFPALRETPLITKAFQANTSGEIKVLSDLKYSGDGAPAWYKVSFIPMGDHRVVLLYENVTIEYQQREQLRQMALQDPLTGSLNRRGLIQALDASFARAERDDCFTALLYFDLDGFKAINDVHGHEAGDDLLIKVTKAVRNTLRGGDALARLGGDEFAVVCERVVTEDDAHALSFKVLSVIGCTWQLDNGHEVKVGVSVGIALSRGRVTDSTTLLRQADEAMYEAKRAGGHQARVVVLK